MAGKALRPSNRVQNGSHTGTVLRVTRRRQGGAWVPVYVVRFSDSDAIRRVRCQHLRTAA
jgi:hypothetical protein